MYEGVEFTNTLLSSQTFLYHFILKRNKNPKEQNRSQYPQISCIEIKVKII